MNPNFPYVGFAECIAVRFARKRWFCVVYLRIIDLLHGPLSKILSPFERLKLAASLAFGAGPAGMRTDPGGILIELLPPPLRDHMLDRYIGGFR